MGLRVAWLRPMLTCEIWVQEAQRKGSRFALHLPLGSLVSGQASSRGSKASGKQVASFQFADENEDMAGAVSSSTAMTTR